MSDQKKQNHYTAEFKESAVKLAIESDQPVAKSAPYLRQERTLASIRILCTPGSAQYHRPQKQKVNRVDGEQFYGELNQLRKDHERLTQERDVLIRATAYFAKESS
jgi:transposase